MYQKLQIVILILEIYVMNLTHLVLIELTMTFFKQIECIVRIDKA
jgi:hypothetical protein